MVVELMRNTKPQIMCLVETKLKELTRKHIKELQGTGDFEWRIKRREQWEVLLLGG